MKNVINKALLNTIMRPLLISGLLSVSALSHGQVQAANASAPQTLDRIIAIVDDDVILASEYRERYESVKANFSNNQQALPDDKELQRQILDQLVVESIQLQMAYRAGVRISDEQLNETLARIAQQNRLSVPQFKAMLEKEGRSYTAVREQIRKDLLIQRVQSGNVSRRIQISDQEIENYLNSEEGKKLTAPEYRFLHALIPLASDASQAQEIKAQEHAHALAQQVRKGTDFSKAITDGGPFNINSGDLGWRKLDDLPGFLTDAATSLSKGEVADPIRSASGFHIVQLLSKRGDGEIIPQTQARHILLKPSAIRDDKATEAEIKALRQRILNGEDFAELAREYSEDIGSASEGGDLSWTSPGQLVPEFQQAMDSTDINGVSPAFRSQYGWHILQVLDRRDKDVTEDMRRRIAGNHLHDRKFKDELQIWLQQIRDEAYVDYK
ncbi:peptidylprolyl isomerase [Dasania sp. GY-MA-18]|uniref:Chaperone SurA n=1 Tax=Dasania phycosphaerae TaxID=2950436 RepID=A0A9J6RJ68_9GAMM|nr:MULTISPECIES: peptidylprolyl isomerase [Dasania]MCR8922314.1 peptidylprolyl isomerase [Dasania sp. GY-MA-18]MCZ0864742.1 peptidylprolyl isomerase [Dasania phycosphaerae]MCZ0868470.1 peptidylprolyl isomerase [Dasania phycosphaerae]